MPLYVAEIVTMVVFVAEDDRDAEINAEDYCREEIDLNGCKTWVHRADRNNVPLEWLNSIPHGTDDDRRVEAHLAEMEAAPPTPAELEAAGQLRL